MKKLICMLMALMIMGTSSFAQTAPAKTTKSKTKTKTETQTDTKAPKTKKDGTADMRYKENKEAAKPTGKLKKDGTPDMRYKANKDAAAKKIITALTSA